MGRIEPFQSFYQGLVGRGLHPEMARLTLARKIVAITLTIGKKGEAFDGLRLKVPAELVAGERPPEPEPRYRFVVAGHGETKRRDPLLRSATVPLD